MEGKNQWVLLENGADDVALHACATTMNDSNFLEPGLPALFEIFLDDARNVLRTKSVEIDRIFDRKDYRFTER